ncbi:TIGR02234 family membrane protein [Mycobacterium deserti]|uniref:TIGR02234 family membrane protein n=1 Tax=Mycobacterium deserti TaxID=2978347 RepID=A0ABT2MC97_9MYCO|nr:TIGR02234 family membrane protein [Mycobacterium deserti]MCT7659894.1 TIGR02234 family membrane protein [Mycobacterium deserti]
MIRVAQLGLVLAAAGLWVASRMTWVEVTSFDGLGQPQTVALSGGTWSTVLAPLAVLLLATAAAALAVRGWSLRLLAVLVAVASAAMAYLALSLWLVRDVAVRASHLVEAPVANLIDSDRHYGGAVITMLAAVVTLAAAVLLMRSAKTAGAARYQRKKVAAQVPEPDAEMSERMIWDALDEGRDPTGPDNKGR